MDPKSNFPGQPLTDMEIKARELGKAKLLRAYMVVLKEINLDDSGLPDKQCPFQVRTLCVVAPSWSHVSARYDFPESGVEIMKQEFLAPGEAYIMPLQQKAEMAEFEDRSMEGLGMCYQCQYDFRNQPGGRCHLGHRTDNSRATDICPGFRQKV